MLLVCRFYSEIIPRDGSQRSSNGPVNVNLSCKSRVKNTEKQRKQTDGYDDDNPPTNLPSDGDGQDMDGDNRKKKLTCSHYRQLSTTRTATMAQRKFAPDQNVVNCCNVGGEKTKLGAADIEDLVDFGVNPYVQKGVAIYRPGGTGSFGALLQQEPGGKGCTVKSLVFGGPAESEGTLKPSDRILKVNGKDMRGKPLVEVTAECAKSRDVLELDVLRDGTIFSEIDNEAYSDHSACPYYLSRALTKHAELVFAPYNYILDPAIRDAMGIDLSGAVVILDEAHNVEDTLRSSGSGKFGEFELCGLMTMLAHHASGLKGTTVDVDGEDKAVELNEVAHDLLLFIEAIVSFLRESRSRFEANPGTYPLGRFARHGERMNGCFDLTLYFVVERKQWR